MVSSYPADLETEVEKPLKFPTFSREYRIEEENIRAEVVAVLKARIISSGQLYVCCSCTHCSRYKEWFKQLALLEGQVANMTEMRV